MNNLTCIITKKKSSSSNPQQVLNIVPTLDHTPLKNQLSYNFTTNSNFKTLNQSEVENENENQKAKLNFSEQQNEQRLSNQDLKLNKSQFSITDSEFLRQRKRKQAIESYNEIEEDLDTYQNLENSFQKAQCQDDPEVIEAQQEMTRIFSFNEYTCTVN
ncbi:hypothetical protein PPERSA_04275 [Pseudocohnilembus persalinus]|uniref:Uncharacterized protein n=1 Tax=Pseudocohnilembus persalinus TaxID=266149 RepID=A0A0V0QNM0_PSEPJ|nr:hypothetical protein PPERSA_04275 [Pseudocohnilembus persalinus]|eukprot:KRX03767.1 hypothetical protein PPERSA_04275 [Pseudocohnilembus persalinus]